MSNEQKSIEPLELLPDDLIPSFHTSVTSQNKKITTFAGKNPLGGYYLAEINYQGIWMFSSPTRDVNNLKPMSFDETHNVLFTLMNICSFNKAVATDLRCAIDVLHGTRILKERAQKEKENRREIIERYIHFKKDEKQDKAPVEHTNTQEKARKLAQKEKILERWSDIAPVFLDSARKEIGAKISGSYVYINLDDKKPSFLILNANAVKIMGMSDLGQFMGVLGENKEFEKVAEHIAIYYQKFAALKDKRPRPKQVRELDIKVKNALYTKIEGMSNILRAKMAQEVKSQMGLD